MSEREWIVVPFERHGSSISSARMYMFDAPAQALHLAREIAPHVPGVAIVERTIDPDTGDENESLIAELGAVPPLFPSAGWSARLS